ncbi:hypothetical protein GCM10017576_23410 [Microbacterium barkeri]|uniref:Uncharacterized protein n=1 Tax=Microbacterium barkeri TaxID=33917 RepID=A0A9W6H4J5_9MICO|nr:hypothetical protein [Microbacterium barkeri]MDI6944198.1 hypothetical protein [Microbacterium barkeri]MDR6876770.1 hypothetical protein [Microbacterium barkeri]GLJ62211.1 hypothetical protein GCM10017576_23410 [Microbacterium barkeri]
MANATAPQTTAAKAGGFDRKDITRMFARLKHEVGGLVDDANRSRPFYAKSKEEAVAKRDAAIKVLNELADRIDVLKKD